MCRGNSRACRGASACPDAPTSSCAHCPHDATPATCSVTKNITVAILPTIAPLTNPQDHLHHRGLCSSLRTVQTEIRPASAPTRAPYRTPPGIADIAPAKLGGQGSPTMTYSYGGVSATSQVFAERRAAMQAQRDTPPYAAFQAVQAVIAAVNAAAEERATAFASTQDASEFWQRYNSVTRGWVPQP
jgi:hypothetical protein